MEYQRYIVSSNQDEFKANFEEVIDNLKEKNYMDAIKNLGVDSLNDENIYHHSNTPDLIDVIDIINDNIKN